MSLRISIFLANKNAAKAVVSCWQRFIMGAVFTRRVVAMKRSRTLRVKTAPIINLCQQLTTAFAAFLFARKILMRKLITYRHSKGFYIYDNLLHGGELAGHCRGPHRPGALGPTLAEMQLAKGEIGDNPHQRQDINDQQPCHGGRDLRGR